MGGNEASSLVEENFKNVVLDRMSDSARASLRSQGGSGAGLPFTTCPTCLVTRLEPHVFRILLLRRLRLPLPFTVRSCRCGLPLDSCGHHRAACAQAGVLGRRGWALESVAARICREAGGRVTTNVLLRDLDVEMPNVADGRRLEVVADGLPLFGGAQLAIDTTLVCALRRDGNPTHNAAIEDGAALRRARQRKVRTYPELVGRHARAKLVVLAVEVGGRWSEEVCSFLSRGENQLLRKRVEQAWRLRWGSLLACTAARAVATSLLELPGARGSDGSTPPSHEVELDFRYARLA